jgi:integrase
MNDKLVTIDPQPLVSLSDVGQQANRAASRTIFTRYLAEKSDNTIKRQARDLELFAEYLLDINTELAHGADFQTNPRAWQGITWGIVEGFVQWQLKQNYAISSVNARLSTVRIYAQMAVKAGTLDRGEGSLIQSVKGYSRQEAANVDDKRARTRRSEITYAYKAAGAKKTTVVRRRNTKKRKPTLISAAQADQLLHIRNSSAQAARDALLLALLLEHGLRASEAALLQAGNLDLAKNQFTFHRPKVKGTVHEWTTHQFTPAARRLATIYLAEHYPTAAPANGRLILGTTRLCKDGTGGDLRPTPLNRVRISERVAWLGAQISVTPFSAHDCRHYCATTMARQGYGVDELMAWFGWTSAQTAVRYISIAEVQKRHRG